MPLKDAWMTHPLCCELPKEVRHRESFREPLSQFSRKSVVSGNLETFAGRKITNGGKTCIWEICFTCCKFSSSLRFGRQSVQQKDKQKQMFAMRRCRSTNDIVRTTFGSSITTALRGKISAHHEQQICRRSQTDPWIAMLKVCRFARLFWRTVNKKIFSRIPVMICFFKSRSGFF